MSFERTHSSTLYSILERYDICMFENDGKWEMGEGQKDEYEKCLNLLKKRGMLD